MEIKKEIEKIENEFQHWWVDAELRLHQSHDLGDSKIVAHSAWDEVLRRLEPLLSLVAKDGWEANMNQDIKKDHLVFKYDSFDDYWEQFIDNLKKK